MRKLSPYYPEDATLTYYNPPGAGAWSVTALRGPYTALPDLSAASDDRVTVGDVRCGRTVIGGSDGPPETEVAGHTCWRTSGDFSVSVLTVLSDLDETVSLVNEYWESQ